MPNSDTHGAATTEAPEDSAPAPEAQAPTPSPTGDTATTDQLQAAVRERKKWEARAKRDQDALKELRAQVKTLVAPEQAEAMQGDLAQTRADLEAARLEALRYRVALAEGLPVDLAARLVGEDEEALVKDAKALKGLVRSPKGTPDKEAGTQPKAQPTMNADQALRAALGLGPRSQ